MEIWVERKKEKEKEKQSSMHYDSSSVLLWDFKFTVASVQSVHRHQRIFPINLPSQSMENREQKLLSGIWVHFKFSSEKRMKRNHDKEYNEFDIDEDSAVECAGFVATAYVRRFSGKCYLVPSWNWKRYKIRANCGRAGESVNYPWN